MHPIRSRFSSPRGYALLSVLMFLGVMAILTASMLKYSASERRLNERNRLVLRARNMAENVALYASEQLTTKLYRLRSATPMAFMSGTNQIYLPPDDVLTTSFSTPSDVEVRAGLTGNTGLLYVDPNDPANANDPSAGLSVDKSTVPIIAKATMRHSALGEVTAYAQQDLQIAMIPLFQFAIFYNMDMEFGPGPDMVISGPVHTNGNMIARIQTGFNNTLQFKERVTAVGGLYANTAHKGKTYMGDGDVDAGPGGTGPLYFQSPSGTVTNIKTNGGTWRDHKYGTNNETSTTRNQFKTFASSTYKGNLRTSAHDVTPLELPSIGGYKETDDPTTPEDDTENGRQLIEPPSPADTADLVQAKLSRRSGLYIIVNPDDTDRTGKMPNGGDVLMRARSYRAFLNTVRDDGSHSILEVVLPGQPSYGPLNANLNLLPNAYRTDTSVGPNQLLRIPQGAAPDLADTGYPNPAVPTFPSITDSYFYDLRRGKGSNGFPFNRPGSNFVPRPIAKIDFDMTRFKMSVARTLNNATTATVYNPSQPNGTNWNRSILNPSANPAAHGLGLGAAFDNFTSVKLDIESKEKPGNGVIKEYDGRFIIAESTDGTTWTERYKSTSNESTREHETTPGTKYVRVRLYEGGANPTSSDDGSNDATTRMMDEQIYTLTTPDGTNDVTATLTNDYHVIAISAGGALPSTHLDNDDFDGDPEFAHTDMRVFVGGIEDTSNWSFVVTGTTGGASGSLGTGTYANRFTWGDLTSAGGTVTITAAKGTATISKTLRLDRQDSKDQFDTPAQQSRWLSTTVTAAADPFRLYFAPSDPTDPRIVSEPSVFEVAPTDLVSLSSSSPWFDGITIYVHSVDAENKTQSGGNPVRVDSGVRLWNGRGPIASLNGASFPGRTGFNFASNDAVYIVGHFNADGSINSNANSTGTGGYSGRYPESASEMLCAVMGDAITLLSQPEFRSNGGNYYQNEGWSDKYSAHRRPGNWSNSWQSSNPSNGNSVDGIATSVEPAAMPNLSTGSVAAAPNSDTKLPPTVTEISTCLLTGIVRTTTAQTSGGVHNFPRLLENWNGTGLYIRGSMVAMFESQVATEPWSIRYYQGAGRYWGLHQNLRAENGAHDLPLEPVVINAQRMRYRELSPADYTAQKAVIEALPH